jgi:hypothetical protein
MATKVTCLLCMASLTLLHATLAGCQAPTSPSSDLASGTAVVAPPTTTVVLPGGTVVPHESVVVRRRKGYLWSAGSAHAFIWEEGHGAIHVVITVSSSNLSLDEPLRIAEGLRAVVREDS